MMGHFLRTFPRKRVNARKLSDVIQPKTSSSPEVVQVKVQNDDFLGQPTSKTHPHIVNQGEVVSGIQLSEVVKRRDQLVKEIVTSKSPGNSHVVVIPSSTTFYMSEDVPYVFRQDSDFRYLTGCLEPDTALVICITPEQTYKSILFTREKNKHNELWEGPRTGPDKAVEYFGVDEAFPVTDLKTVLHSKIKGIGPFNLWYDFQSSCQPTINDNLSSIIPDSGCEEVLNPEMAIHRLRVIKSEAEQKLMAKSCQIISESFIETMKRTKSLTSEHQVYATVDYEARMRGAEMLAYPPVVACGSNANVIHYIRNSQALSHSKLILMDAGCELHGYASDVTRTWPVSGKFTDIQHTLYDVVLTVQEELLARFASHRPSLDSLLETMNELLYQRLSEAHVLTKLAANQNHRAVSHKFCPHHVGHYLGMDVHDTATVPKHTQVREGMVITVEPGVYITQLNDFAKPEFRGSGIRVEDDVLVTTNGIQILSTCPKSAKDMEQLCTL